MKHLHLETCLSTQDEIKKSYDGAPILISCDKQTKGRGRGKNQWHHMQNSLACSFTLSAHNVLTLSSIEVAVMLCDFFSSHYQLELQLKWPNDLFYKNKKIGGIIINNSSSHLFVGIGLNLFKEKESNYEALFHDDFSIKQKELALQIFNYCQKNRLQDANELISKWMNRCLHLHKNVQIIDQQNNYQGRFKGINQYGFAIVDEKTFSVGSLLF